jgi:hypothetical protein
MWTEIQGGANHASTEASQKKIKQVSLKKSSQKVGL